MTGYAPQFLEKAGKIADPLEQMKLTIAYLISSFHLTI